MKNLFSRCWPGAYLCSTIVDTLIGGVYFTDVSVILS